MTYNGILDLDAIRASRAACADIPWSCPCVSGEQLDALIAEVERLRDADAKTQAWWAWQVKAERAAVVAWLRSAAGRIDDATLSHAADCIEDGEHRREDER